MLIALNSKKERVLAARDSAKDAYTCQCCLNPVVFKPGHVMVSHFAHRPGSDCTYGGLETENHRQAKVGVCDALARLPGCSAALEVPLEGCRPDVLATVAGTRVAIEVQHSHLSIEELEARTENYARLRIPVLWLLPADERFAPEHQGILPVTGGRPEIRTRLQERWLHATYGRRLFSWVAGSTVRSLTLMPSKRQTVFERGLLPDVGIETFRRIGRLWRLPASAEEARLGGSDDDDYRSTRLERVRTQIEMAGPRPWRLHDHKGHLTVWWPDSHTAIAGKMIVYDAWSSAGEDGEMTEHRVGWEGYALYLKETTPQGHAKWPMDR